MTLFADRVKESTRTTGIDTYLLDGGVVGFQTFSSGFPNGASVHYCCENSTDWEVGRGVLTSTATGWTIARDTIHASSNGGLKVVWVGGSKNIFATYPATDATSKSDLASISDSTLGSALIGFLPSGDNAVGRTVQNKLRDIVNIGDYTNLTTAKTAAGNKIIVDPDGITYKDNFGQSLGIFTEAVDTAWKGGVVHRSNSVGTHAGVSRVAQSVEMRPTGSGSNGPSVADYGQSISVIKQDFFNTEVRGEIDGLNITVRQGGRAVGGISDCAGILLNVGTVHGTGWAGSIEAQTSTFNATTAAVQTQVQSAMAVLDSSTSSYYGFTTTSNVGTLGDAFLATEAGSAAWTNFLRFNNSSGVDTFIVDRAGRITIKATSGATPAKTIRALSGSLSILNDAQSAELFNLTDAGKLSIASNFSGTTYIAVGAAANQGSGTVVYGGTTSATASAGTAGAPPAQVNGYIVLNIDNTQVKVPFYAN